VLVLVGKWLLMYTFAGISAVQNTGKSMHAFSIVSESSTQLASLWSDCEASSSTGHSFAGTELLGCSCSISGNDGDDD